MQWSMTLEMKYLMENVYISLKSTSDQGSRNGFAAPTFFSHNTCDVFYGSIIGKGAGSAWLDGAEVTL